MHVLKLTWLILSVWFLACAGAFAADVKEGKDESIAKVPAVRRGCAPFPTIVCHSGRPEICLEEDSDSCEIEACIVQHENKHLLDIAEQALPVCEGRKDGELAQTPYAKKVLLERSAIKVEQACLQNLKRSAQSDCRRRISERLKRVAQFDSGCVRGTESCVSPITPKDPKEMVTLDSW